MTTVLGIDGGGSGTRAVLATPEGRVLGVGKAGPANPRSVSRRDTRAALDAAAAGAWRAAGRTRAAADAAFLGIAGVRHAEERDESLGMARELHLGAEIGVHHDLRIALTGATGGAPGTVLVAGTGSACYGRSPTGQEARAGGHGPAFGDAGSGYAVALAAIRQALRETDGLSPQSALGRAVFRHFAPDGDDCRLNARTRSEIAAFCPEVLRLANSGEPGAESIVTGAAEALAELCATVARRLDMAAPRVVRAGGFAGAPEFFGRWLRPALLRHVPDAAPETALLSPAGGAVLEALRLLGATPEAATLRALGQSGLCSGLQNSRTDTEG